MSFTQENLKYKGKMQQQHLFNEFRNQHSENISWESEQIAKSHGIYLLQILYTTNIPNHLI